MEYFLSKRIWIAILILLGIFLLKLNPYLIAALLFIIAFLYNTKTVRPLKNYKFWIVILFLVLLVPLFTGVQDSSLFGIKYSSEKLQKTLFMTLRGISVFLLFQVLTSDLNIEKIKPVFSKIGINSFDVLYHLSNEIFPKITSILNARYTQFKTNWKYGRSPELVLLFFSDIFSDLILLSDQLNISESKFKAVSPAEFLMQKNLAEKPCLIVVVGDAGSGKTKWMVELIKLLQSHGETVDGLISQKCQESEDKWYHNIVRISTNEKLQLTTMTEIETEIKIGKFYFYQRTINWANKQLKSVKNTDWIVIDEVGLLEFDKGGFFPGLQAVVANISGCLIITLRSALHQHLDDFISKQLPLVKTWRRHIIKL